MTPKHDNFATVTKDAHDGDSIILRIDIKNVYLQFSGVNEEEVRLAHFDAPELTQPKGVEARDFLRSMLRVGQTVRVLTYGREKWRRPLVDIYQLGESKSISEKMIEAGYIKQVVHIASQLIHP